MEICQKSGKVGVMNRNLVWNSKSDEGLFLIMFPIFGIDERQFQPPIAFVLPIHISNSSFAKASKLRGG